MESKFVLIAEILDTHRRGYIIGFVDLYTIAEQTINEHYQRAKADKQSYLQMLKKSCISYPVMGDDYFTSGYSISDGSLTISSIALTKNFNTAQFIAERQQRTENFNYEQMDKLFNQLAFKQVSNPN